jgi:hypothetical protein
LCYLDARGESFGQRHSGETAHCDFPAAVRDSGVGVAATLAIHVAALFGARGPFHRWFIYFAPTLFAVWLPAVAVMGSMTREAKQKDLWRAALRGCPKWMRRTVWTTGGYSWIAFFLLPVLYGGGMSSTESGERAISAVFMTFWAAAAAIFYSATQYKRVDKARRCANGHPVSPLAKFCEECGAAVSGQN